MVTAEGNVIKKRPHDYTPLEMAAISQGVMDTMNDLDELAREKDTANKEFKARQADLDDKLKTLRQNHSRGFETREYECVVARDTKAGMVNYIDVNTSLIVASEPFTKADWEIVQQQSQLGLFDESAPSDAVLETGPRLAPDFDSETGEPIPGPKTTLYNQKYPNGPYKHLLEDVDFAPATPSTGLDSLDAEAQVYYNDTVAALAAFTVDQLKEVLPEFEGEVPDLLPNIYPAREALVTYIQGRITALETPTSDDTANTDEFAADTNATPPVDVQEEDGDEGKDEEDGEADEPTDEDKPAPRVPKRPARKKK